jgi:hypothetical protein
MIAVMFGWFDQFMLRHTVNIGDEGKKSWSALDGSDRVDDDDGVLVDCSNCLDHFPPVPPQGQIVSIAHISNNDLVKPEFTAHTVTLSVRHLLTL